MPIYEFDCPGCGTFSLSRPMAESGLPARCACGQHAQRVLSAPSVRGSKRPSRGAEPELVSTKNREPAKPKEHAGHGRPWMLSH
jgi:putative FmdB family regulatory protein